jgi:hypothetical protein
MTFEAWFTEFIKTNPDGANSEDIFHGGKIEGVREGLTKAIHVSCITCQHGYKPVKNSEGQFMHLNGSALCNANRFHKLIAKLDGK